MRVSQIITVNALLVLGLLGCTGPNDQPVPAPPTSTTVFDQAASTCSEHFDDIRYSEPITASSIHQLGPAMLDPPPGPFADYPDDEPVALCLVPNAKGTFDVIAVLASTGETFIWWVQNQDDALTWPI